MHFSKAILLIAAVLCSTAIALPQTRSSLLSRSESADSAIHPDSQCRNCKDCYFDEKSSSTKTLDPEVSTDSSHPVYQDGKGLSVDFKSVVNTKSAGHTQFFTISAKHGSVGYKVQVTYKKLPPGTGSSPVEQNGSGKFIYELISPTICTAQVPAGYTISEVQSVKIQPLWRVSRTGWRYQDSFSVHYFTSSSLLSALAPCWQSILHVYASIYITNNYVPTAELLQWNLIFKISLPCLSIYGQNASEECARHEV